MLGIERRLRNRSGGSAMATVAGDLCGSVKVARIQIEDHAEHLARFDLVGLYVGVIGVLVAVLAVNAERVGEERHGGPELFFGKVLQDLDILEDVAGELGFWWFFRVLGGEDAAG